jgi:hypothetical protein
MKKIGPVDLSTGPVPKISSAARSWLCELRATFALPRSASFEFGTFVTCRPAQKMTEASVFVIPCP